MCLLLRLGLLIRTDHFRTSESPRTYKQTAKEKHKHRLEPWIVEPALPT